VSQKTTQLCHHPPQHTPCCYSIMKYSMLLALAATATAAALSQKEFPRTWSEFNGQGKSLESLFQDYKATFGKVYSTEADEELHFAQFKATVQKIFEFNERKKQGELQPSYTKGITRFTDMSTEERRGYVMPETNAAEVSS
jgi:hypothetical protein